MEDVEGGVSLQTFEHVTCSVDGQQRGNLNMWSVVSEYKSFIYAVKIDGLTIL